MNRNNIKIWLLFPLVRHHLFLLRNSLQLLILIKASIKLAQLATTLKCQLSSHKHQSTTSPGAKSSVNYLNITSKPTTIRHGTKTQDLESMTTPSWAKNNSILPVKTPSSNPKSQTARMQKTRPRHQGQEPTRLWSP